MRIIEESASGSTSISSHNIEAVSYNHMELDRGIHSSFNIACCFNNILKDVFRNIPFELLRYSAGEEVLLSLKFNF